MKQSNNLFFIIGTRFRLCIVKYYIYIYIILLVFIFDELIYQHN
jgi:hypothetical protein